MMMGLGAAAVTVSASVVSAATTGSSALSLRELKELNLKAGLYDPHRFQAVPSCQYAFASLKIHNTVSVLWIFERDEKISACRKIFTGLTPLNRHKIVL